MDNELTIQQKIEKIRSCTDYRQMAWDWFPPAHADEYYFVSYSHKDYKEVFEDIYALQGQGLHVWYDRELRPGKDWEIEARAHIYDFKCKGVIFYIGKNSVISDSIHREIEFVKRSGKSYLSINLPVDGEYLSAAEILKRVQPKLGKKDEKYKTLEETFNDKVTYLKLSEEPLARAQRIKSALVSLPLLKFEIDNDSNKATVTGINDINANVITAEDFICQNENGEIVPVTEIGSCAFANCRFLEKIDLPNSLEKLETYALYNCFSLKHLVIPDGVEVIGENAFNNCDALKSITIPDSIIKIGDGAFCGCAKLKRVTVPYNAANNSPHKSNDGASPKGRSLLVHLMLEEVQERTDNIMEGKEYNNESVTKHPGTKLLIGNNAFSGCTSLESITIPQGMKGIGNKAFFGCNALKSITLPVGVLEIAADAFDGCDSLTSLETDNRLEEYGINSSQNGILYEDKTKLIRVPTGAKGVLNIPYGVTQIGDFAFRGCTSLGSITIPDSVTFIGNDAFSDCIALTSIAIPGGVTSMGEDVFKNCPSLERIEVDVENQKYASQDGILYNKEKTQIVHVPQAIKGAVTIPDGITEIGIDAFQNCHALTSIIIPDSVTEIGYEAFYDCTSLKSITISDRVTEIGFNAFCACASLERVTIGNGVTFIGGFTFEDCTALESIIIPDSVTSIGEWAFAFCTSLQEFKYSGTIEQWKKIEKDDDWDFNTTDYIIYCTDGEIHKDGTVVKY